MVLNKLLAIFFIFSSFAHARSILPILSTKQAINNLRFFSKDGKYTYYQRRSGDLLMSTNYNVTEVIKGTLGTNYNLIASEYRTRILASKDENYHTFFSPRSLKEIFSIEFGKTKATLLGEGINPRLHLKDQWASFYNPYKKTITVKNLITPTIFVSIKLNNSKNPFFIPQVVMLDNDKILFTDLNDKGYPGLILYKKNSNSSSVVYKVPSQNRKIELCIKNDLIYVGEFGLDPIEKESHIFSLSPQKMEISERKSLYNVKLNDIGNMICNIKGDSIYFVKNTSKKTGRINYEAAQLDVKTKKIEVISDVDYANQIIEMDGKLLLPYQGKYYVLLGEDNMTNFDLLKPKKDKE